VALIAVERFVAEFATVYERVVCAVFREFCEKVVVAVFVCFACDVEIAVFIISAVIAVFAVFAVDDVYAEARNFVFELIPLFEKRPVPIYFLAEFSWVPIVTVPFRRFVYWERCFLRINRYESFV